MDEGEAETIPLAMELNDAILILDDKKARRVAKQIGLKVIGTVGMLLYQIRVSYPRDNPVRAGELCLCSSDFNRLLKRLA